MILEIFGIVLLMMIVADMVNDYRKKKHSVIFTVEEMKLNISMLLNQLSAMEKKATKQEDKDFIQLAKTKLQEIKERKQ